MRFSTTLATILLFLFCTSLAIGGATIDGNPYTRSWVAVPNPIGDFAVGNTGDVFWDGGPVAQLTGIQYTQITGRSQEKQGSSHFDIQGESEHLTLEETVEFQPEKRLAIVRLVFTAKTDAAPLPQIELIRSGHNTNPRFYSMSGGKAVTGTLMDLPIGRSLDLEKYFEAGPMKTQRADKKQAWLTQLTEVSDNLVIRTEGMPMENYGHLGTRIWAQPRAEQLAAGQSVSFEIRTSMVTAEEPRQKYSADAAQVTEPRVWKFLASDPPAKVGDLEVEILPADRHAPVFTAAEVPQLRIRVRAVEGAVMPAGMALHVSDAFSGAEIRVVKLELPASAQDGWHEVVAPIDVPAGSVYNCRLDLTSGPGETIAGPTVELVRCGRIDQPVLAADHPPKWVLFDTINCADPNDPHPFYSNSGASAIKPGPQGGSRESAQKPSDWFGYRVEIPKDVRVCRIEVDFPDDAARDVGVSVNEPIDPDKPGETWGQVRTATGYFTGLVMPLSNADKTFESLYFPASPWATIELTNCHWSPAGAPAAVKQIRLYRLDEEDLPQLPGYAEDPQRIFATFSEQGPIAGLAFNVDPEFRDGHNHYGYQPPQMTKIPREHFFKHWYSVIAQHIKYLRYRGDTGYVYGAMMYTTARYPSKYMNNPAGWNEPRYDEAALYAGMFGENGLKVIYNVEFCSDYRFFQTLSYTDYEIRHGLAESELEIDAAGRQRVLAGLVQTPSTRMNSDLLRQCYGDIVRELAEYYGRYPGAAGVVSTTGGAWFPMYYSEDAPMNDSVVALFEQKTGMKLPAFDRADPERFAKRWAWLQHNARRQWKSFRAEMLADFHKDMAAQVKKTAGGWTYTVLQGSSAHDPFIKDEISSPLDYYRSLAYDPELYRGVENLSYCKFNFGMFRVLSQSDWVPVLLEKGPLGNPQSPASKFRKYLLDRELAEAHEGHWRTALLINTQFDEHMAATNIHPKRPWMYVGIHPNIQYAQPFGSDLLFDFACAFARNTPDDLFYMWADGTVQMGEEPQMQHVARFIRALPRGQYVNETRVADPIYVRRLQGGEAVFYCVNTSRSQRQTRVPVGDGVAGVKDRVTGQVSEASGGWVTLELDSFDLCAFEEMSAATTGR